MIIIEGADGLGKSTLALALRKHFNTPLVHFNPLPDWWQWHDWITRCMTFAVYDRYHWSCYAYKEVRQQPVDLDVEWAVHMDKALHSRNNGKYATILLYASDLSHFDRPERRKDQFFSPEQIASVNQRYREVADKFTMAWDVTLLGKHTSEVNWPDPLWFIDALASIGITELH